ncbi:hypothetical protein ACFVFH_15455 [Streptomyces sp. NPDC057697]|uniref:hypothetical protein n=1 Tax=Streptomyces sp. NPDC057697 TaxID=3346219 RepID=UPI0036C83224
MTRAWGRSGQGRSLRTPAWAVLAVVVVAATGCASDAQDPAGDDMAPAARTYVSKALSIMEELSLFRHQIDGNALRSRTFSQARGAQKPADTYGAVESALGALGDLHSTFRDPGQAKEGTEASTSSFDGLEGRSMKNGIGYVSLPRVSGSRKTYDAYVRQGRGYGPRRPPAGTAGPPFRRPDSRHRGCVAVV